MAGSAGRERAGTVLGAGRGQAGRLMPKIFLLLYILHLFVAL